MVIKMTIKVKTMVITAVLAAMSAVLMLFPKFPIIPAFPFLEVDFSDVPALFASVAISPLCGLAVVFLKNFIHFLTATSTGGVGELSNFICGSALVVSCGLFTKALFKNTLYRKKLLVTLPLACVCQLVFAVLCNYFLMIPLYKIEAMAKEYILGGVLPFNLVKDVLVCIVFYLIFIAAYPKIRKTLTEYR